MSGAPPVTRTSAVFVMHDQREKPGSRLYVVMYEYLYIVCMSGLTSTHIYINARAQGTIKSFLAWPHNVGHTIAGTDLNMCCVVWLLCLSVCLSVCQE